MKKFAYLGVGSAVLIGACLLPCAFQSEGGASFKPGKLPKDEVEALKPGMHLRLLVDKADKPADLRQIRLAALHVPEGQAPSVLVPAGPFQAKISGYLKVALRGDFHFRLEAKGSAILRINTREALKADNNQITSEGIELAKGYNKIEVEFTSPAKGDATVHVSWKGDDFAWEPVPPHVLFARGDDAELVRLEKVREGRHLFGRLECAHCHALPDGLKVKDAALPELHHRAPLLSSAGHRLQEDWIARWLLNPHALRPEATMPSVLSGRRAEQQACDLAAYLGTLKEGKAPAESMSTEERVGKGEYLFQSLGCVSCHRLSEPGMEDNHGRLSLFHGAAKYRPGALEAFLLKPHENYLWSRMPDFKLKGEEAASLTAYLLDQAKGKVEALEQKGDAERGKRLYEEAGCVRCHGLATEAALALPVRPSPARDKITAGCLAADDKERGKAPDFHLSESTREALKGFLEGDSAILKRETPAEFSRRQMDNLQCLACHRRDGLSSRLQKIREEDGEIPEVLPILTWAGEKLKPEWTQKLLHGEVGQRARPWLKARMPAFPARADLLSVGLSHEHGFNEKEHEAPAHDPKLADSGEKLLPQVGGFNCVMCHGVGDQKATAPFEAPGINLLDAANRLRYPYYQRWMLDPPRLDPLTRMPKLAPDGKTTPLPEFDGDAARQFGAIWHHMQTLRKK